MAEGLGHLKYSQLIQDCFQDLAVVEQYKAEVYQYVGDEAVLTWRKEVGLENANCLNAYFAFCAQLDAKATHYSNKYGVVPQFKAGLNVGKVTVAEVGEVKREIAYHGDAINTAARIQAKCNEMGRALLISEHLHLQLNGQMNGFKDHLEGSVQLKGKMKAINVYSVQQG